MGNWHRVIGIDLGTTFSAVAAYNFDKQTVLIIPNKQNDHTTPSVVYIAQDGNVSVGKAAKDKLGRDPGGVIIEVKRIMGEKEVGGAKAMVRAPGRQAYDPEFISAHILKELKKCAEKFIGEPVHDAVITVPAYFKESQKNATKEAARLAELNPLLIMNEPTAAAVAYAHDAGEKQTFIVYDLGGGTFDVSIVRANDARSFDVLGTGGDAHLGGGDIDQKIVDWALARMKAEHGRDFSGDGKLVGKLRLKAEEVKILLCNESSDQDFFVESPTAGVGEINYRLEVDEFERMIRTLLDRTLKQVEVAMASARRQHDLSMEDVEAFILVGGSSKIPAVKRVLAEKYGKPVKDDLNPDEVVALGAGLMAKGYPPSTAFEVRENVSRSIDRAARTADAADHPDIKDVVSHTLGVGLKDDVYDRLITKDSEIPHRVVRDGYTTAEDNQTRIYVPVYQGENPKASLNTKLGEVIIDGLAPEPKGAHRFSITFGLDANGIFDGELKHHQTHQVTPIKLDRGQGQLTEKKLRELSEMVKSGKAATGGTPEASAPGGSSGGIGGGMSGGPQTDVISEANKILHMLPPNRQQEITGLISRLAIARATNDMAAVSLATELAMLVARYKQN